MFLLFLLVRTLMVTDPLADALRASAKESNRESNLVRMYGRPGNQALQLNSVVADCADLNQFRFHNLRISHEVNASTRGQSQTPRPVIKLFEPEISS